MADKVHGGTPVGNQSLCVTCRAAHVVRGVNMQEMTICRVGQAFTVKFPVATCSAYDDKRQPPIWEMEKIAWQVQSRSRGPVGFTGGRSLLITIEPPSNPFGPPMQPAPTSELREGMEE